jgi:murein lipoprotein
MNKLIKITALTLASSLVGGCATQSDIDNLQSQFDILRISVAQTSSDAAWAKSAAFEAKAIAEKAEHVSLKLEANLVGILNKRFLCDKGGTPSINKRPPIPGLTK